MKKKIRKGFEDYDRIKMGEIITFGTCLYLRKDRQALKIVFPCGQAVTFAPLDEREDGNRLEIA